MALPRQIRWLLPLLVTLGPAIADQNELALVKSSRYNPRTSLEMSTEFFIVPERNKETISTNSAAVVIVTSRTPPCAPDDVKCAPTAEDQTINPIFHNLIDSDFFRKEPWVIPLLVLASLTMFLIACFEVFVLCKAWQTTPSRRHLFLGQMLLLGLFMCAGLAAVVAKAPSPTSCATLRFGTGLAFAIVFSALLVKCVFLISLNSGVYLPAPYQALLLLFAVLIQIVVGVQWLFNSPPRIDILPIEDTFSTRKRFVVTASDLLVDIESLTPICHTTYGEILLSLIYVVFLILFVAVLAIKSRGIRDNYREATYIGLSVGCVIPMWFIWALTGLVLAERHRDACLGFGLVSTAIVVFLIMFMPKGRQLAAMGKEGVYIEDREDRFSSLSPAGSGYSPSFFHFKPVKYGMVGDPNLTSVATTHKTTPSGVTTIGDYVKPSDLKMYSSIEPTLSINPNVYFHRGSAVHPGMMY